MKKFALTILIIFASINLFAQLEVVSGGKVGIGFNNPTAPLHAIDAIALHGSGLDGLTTQKGQIYANTSLGLYFDAPKTSTGAKLPIQFNWRGGGTPAIYITGQGEIGLWNDEPDYELDVNGDIATYGTVRISSDKRFKENIRPIGESLFRLNQINGIAYEQVKIKTTHLTGTDSLGVIDNEAGKTKFGVVAQDIKEIFPELVDQTKDGYYNVDYIGLIPVIIEALQEQQAEIEELKNKISSLEQNNQKKQVSLEEKSSDGMALNSDSNLNQLE